MSTSQCTVDRCIPLYVMFYLTDITAITLAEIMVKYISM